MLLESLGLVAAFAVGLILFFKRKDPLSHIPGPPGLPLLGNAHQISLSGFVKCFETWALQYGGMYKVNLVGTPVLVVSDINALLEIHKRRPDCFSRDKGSQKALGELGFGGLFIAEGEEWKLQRPLIANCLNQKRVNEFKPCIAKHVFDMRKVVARIAGKNEALARLWAECRLEPVKSSTSAQSPPSATSPKELFPCSRPNVQDLHDYTEALESLALSVVSDVTFSWGNQDFNKSEHLQNLKLLFDLYPEKARNPLPSLGLFKTEKERRAEKAKKEVYRVIDSILKVYEGQEKKGGEKEVKRGLGAFNSVGSLDFSHLTNTVLQNLLSAKSNLTDESIKSNMMLLMIAGFGKLTVLVLNPFT
jgi:cytochrome P450